MTDFPTDNWYIEITDENRKILNDWKIKQKYNNDLFQNSQYKCVNWNGAGGGMRGVSGVLITTEQFIEHVLKQSPVKTSCKDYNYLMGLFKKLGIR